MRPCEKCKTNFEGIGKFCPDCRHNIELEQKRKLINGPDIRLTDDEKRKMIEERKRDRKFWWG